MSEKILYKNNEYHMMVTENEKELNLSWEDAYGHNNLTPISKDVLEQIVLGERTPSDLLFYAENDVWPPKVTQEEANRNFLRDNIALLQNDADNQQLFTRAELEKILPKGTEILASSDEAV
ncbi:hypothetical protein [Lactovum odontotermitis]